MKFTHPYSKYGLALILLEEGINSADKITHQMLKKHLILGLGHYRIAPTNSLKKNGQVDFSYIEYESIKQKKKLQSSGNPKQGIYLAPNFITTDMQAKNTWKKVIGLIKDLENEKSLSKSYGLTKSIVPVSNKFNAGKLSQSYPKATFLEACLCAITTITPYKPSLAFKTKEKGQISYTPQAVIPDLSITDMVKFIELFKMILRSRTEKLMVGNIQEDEKENRIYFRPRVHRGNFPFAPQSSSLASIGLLAAIGRWAEDAEYRDWAKEVLKSLSNIPIYLISYDDSKSTTYNHYVVNLAKENELNKIIYGLERTKLYGEKRLDLNSPKYQRFSLFASRFLQLFNPPAFRDFLAFRAEYEPELLILLQTYFGDVMNIPSDIVHSARILGKWLNSVAYFAAKNETENPKDYESLNKAKAKALIELESAVFSAKTGAALISQVITRAGRLTGTDAPEEATVFMEAVAEGRLNLDDAKNLLTAFSRIRGSSQKETPEEA